MPLENTLHQKASDMDSKSLVALRAYLRERSRILLLSKILLDKAQIVESGGDISRLM